MLLFSKTKNIYLPAHLLPLLFAIVCGGIIWLLPIPSGIEPKAWSLFAIFVGLIVGLIGKALPMGGISFLALTLLIVTKTLTIKEAFSGFSNPVVWLVVSAFLISRSFIKTGLGMRIAYHFVALLGKKTLGLGYGIATTELLLAPFIPSNTARGGGIVFPVVRALAVSFESTPEKHSQRLVGSFLIMVAYYSNLISSAFFVTAMAANPLILEIFSNHNIHLSWSSWAMAAFVPALFSFVLMPYLIYKIYPPEIKTTPEAKKIAHAELAKMGKITLQEWLTLAVFLFLIVFWIFGEHLGLESTTVALMGVCLLMLTGVLTWNDIKKEHEAWDTLIWLATLLTIATFLNTFGLIPWVSHHMHYFLKDFSWPLAFLLLLLSYFYSHYFFASISAHVTSMFGTFLGVGIALNIPPYLIGLSLAYTTSLYACLTHYGTGTAPILFGSEYVNLKTWWKLGLVMSFFFLSYLDWGGLSLVESLRILVINTKTYILKFALLCDFVPSCSIFLFALIQARLNSPINYLI
jgi:DASS family divalent anion:Na+ symporter